MSWTWIGPVEDRSSDNQTIPTNLGIGVSGDVVLIAVAQNNSVQINVTISASEAAYLADMLEVLFCSFSPPGGKTVTCNIVPFGKAALLPSRINGNCAIYAEIDVNGRTWLAFEIQMEPQKPLRCSLVVTQIVIAMLVTSLRYNAENTGLDDYNIEEKAPTPHTKRDKPVLLPAE